MGFSANPSHPLEPSEQRINKPFFKFDPQRLVEVDGWLEYVIEAPPDWQRKAYHFDGRKAFLPGMQDTEATHSGEP
jgi:hypothetical protein